LLKFSIKSGILHRDIQSTLLVMFLFSATVWFPEYNFSRLAGVLVDKQHALLNRLACTIEGKTGNDDEW
jgi:hypothetical protein